MARSTAAIRASDEAIRDLLKRYRCPVPFHEARTRFLGSIVTPVLHASPVMVVRGLWRGGFPAFLSQDETKELLDTLVIGLWNHLRHHQEDGSQFRLMSVEMPSTPEGLAALALMRRQELDGFVDGLFAEEAVIELPKQADLSLDLLTEMRALFAGVAELAGTHTGRALALNASFTHLRALTRNAEREIDAVVISCTAARREALASVPGAKPVTLH